MIGHDPDAPGAFGELMMVSEMMSRKVPDGVPADSVAVVDAFAVGEFYVRCSGIGPGELPLVIGLGDRALDGGRVGRPGDRPDRHIGLQRRQAGIREEVRSRRPGQPGKPRPVRRLAGDVREQRYSDTAGHLRMRRPQRPAAEHRRFMRVHGARVLRGRMVRRGHDRLHGRHTQGDDHPVRRWTASTGLVRHARCGRRRPTRSSAQHRQGHRP